MERCVRQMITSSLRTFGVLDDSAEELYILNHMAPRAFGLTDQQVYDIIALAIWDRKNQ